MAEQEQRLIGESESVQKPSQQVTFDAGQIPPAGSQTIKLDTVSRLETGSNPGSHFPYLFSDL